MRFVGVRTTGVLAFLACEALEVTGRGRDGSSASMVSRRGCDTLIVVNKSLLARRRTARLLDDHAGKVLNNRYKVERTIQDRGIFA